MLVFVLIFNSPAFFREEIITQPTNAAKLTKKITTKSQSSKIFYKYLNNFRQLIYNSLAFFREEIIIQPTNAAKLTKKITAKSQSSKFFCKY